MIEDIRGDFAKKWEAGQIEGWNLRSGIDKSIEEAKKKQAEVTEAKSLDEYIEHIRRVSTTLSESLIEHYERMICTYKEGNSGPLLSNLYDRLLAADEYKQKITEELKSLLRDL